jgi:hypothetical protein
VYSRVEFFSQWIRKMAPSLPHRRSLYPIYKINPRVHYLPLLIWRLSKGYRGDGWQTLRGHIPDIWIMRNLSIWLFDPFQIWPIKSAYSGIQNFDWVLVSRVVCIIQIFRICPLSVCNPYNYFWAWFLTCKSLTIYL